jgi:hypothetical protein
MVKGLRESAAAADTRKKATKVSLLKRDTSEKL